MALCIHRLPEYARHTIFRIAGDLTLSDGAEPCALCPSILTIPDEHHHAWGFTPGLGLDWSPPAASARLQHRGCDEQGTNPGSCHPYNLEIFCQELLEFQTLLHVSCSDGHLELGTSFPLPRGLH